MGIFGPIRSVSYKSVDDRQNRGGRAPSLSNSDYKSGNVDIFCDDDGEYTRMVYLALLQGQLEVIGKQTVDPTELLHLNKVGRLIDSTGDDWSEYDIASGAAQAIEQEGATDVHFQRSNLLGPLPVFRAVYESDYPAQAWMKAFGDPSWMIPHHLKVHGKESDPLVYVGAMKIGSSGQDERGAYVDVLYRLTVGLLGFKDRFFIHRYRIRSHPVVPGGKILEWTNVEHLYLDAGEGQETIKSGIGEKTSREFYDLLTTSLADAVHPQQNMGAYEVVPLENGRYRVTQYYWADFGGRVPDWVSASLTKSSFPKLVARNFQVVRKALAE